MYGVAGVAPPRVMRVNVGCQTESDPSRSTARSVVVKLMLAVAVQSIY